MVHNPSLASASRHIIRLTNYEFEETFYIINKS